MNLLYLWTGGAIPWPGSTATIGVAATSDKFTPGWSTSVANVGVEATSGSWHFTQIWHGSTAAIGAAADSGGFDGNGRAFGQTGIMVIARHRVETRLHRTRTAMMVGTGNTRGGR